MTLTWIDVTIICLYIVITLGIGFLLSKKASTNIDSYFLGGNKIKWYFLGLSNASGMFDISGTMWTVTILFVYGVKSAWIPWLWPVWNQVFVMIFLAIWMRRSNVMTGAEWILTRFSGRGGKLSHIVVIVFAVISVIGFMAYFFEGIGKFAVLILPWDLATNILGMSLTSAQSYALIIMGITVLYTLKGGMYSVVAADIFQFVILTTSCIMIGVIAYTSVTGEQISQLVPQGWNSLFGSLNQPLDWGGVIPAVNNKISSDGYGLFGTLIMLMVFKGVFASLAGPVPSYDMQRILSTRKPSEAAKMSGFTIAILFAPRYLMVASFAVLSIVYLHPQIVAMGNNIDFETILPMAITKFVPTGLKGLFLAGLLASFMGSLSAFVNSAPAYIVNDLYKKYINPNAKPKTYIRASYLATLTLVIVGIAFGFFASSLNTLTLWLTSSLYGGYAAANVLKWIWWRFNGYGYFWGMIAGLTTSTLKLALFPGIVDIYFFPVILVASMIGSVMGCLLTQPDDEELLIKFYRNVRPWGFWKPIRQKVQAIDPSFEPNRDFARDAMNVVVGIAWQMSLVVLPIFFIIKDTQSTLTALGMVVLCTVILKFTWYDHLSKADIDMEENLKRQKETTNTLTEAKC